DATAGSTQPARTQAPFTHPWFRPVPATPPPSLETRAESHARQHVPILCAAKVEEPHTRPTSWDGLKAMHESPCPQQGKSILTRFIGCDKQCTRDAHEVSGPSR